MSTAWLAIVLAAGFGMKEYADLARYALLVSWPFGVVAFWCALSSVKSKIVRRWATLVCAMVFAAITWKFLPTRTPEVYPLFRTTYEELRQRLNEPVSPAINGRNAYVANCDKGVAIWLAADSIYYGVPNDQSMPVTAVRDPMWDPEEDWGDRDAIKKKFKDIGMDIPKDHTTPYLGFASHYYKDPERWKWIGWPTWDCSLDGNRTYFQSFKNGIIIGPLPVRQGATTSRIVVIFGSDHLSVWQQVADQSPAWTCSNHK
jgi:hypothetical protein